MTVDKLPELISAFANAAMTPEVPTQAPTRRASRLGTDNKVASFESFSADSFRRDSKGYWQGGAHPGHKLKLPVSPTRHVSAEPASPMSSNRSLSSAKSNLPSTLFISELVSKYSESYCVTQTLAKGTQGKFRIAKRGESYFGVKEYRLRNKGRAYTSATCLAEIEREWQTAQSCNAKLRVHDVIQHGEKISVVTDLFGQDLQQASRQVSPARRAQFVRGAMLDLAKTLAKMHARGYVHLDVKPENALVADGYVTLSDFGCATALDADGTFASPQGTPAFFSPERWRTLRYPEAPSRFDAKVDVWALAIAWSHLHQISVPFSRGDARYLGTTFACMDAYEDFLEQVLTPQGEIDTTRILSYDDAADGQVSGRKCPHQALIDDFYKWAKDGLRVDEALFRYLLCGPLQVCPNRRPAMADMVSYLQSEMAPSHVRYYVALTTRLAQGARYRFLQKKSAEELLSPSASERRLYTVGQIKSELQLFSASSGSSHGSLGIASLKVLDEDVSVSSKAESMSPHHDLNALFFAWLASSESAGSDPLSSSAYECPKQS